MSGVLTCQQANMLEADQKSILVFWQIKFENPLQKGRRKCRLTDFQTTPRTEVDDSGRK